MTEQVQENQAVVEQKTTDKEINFRAFEAKMQRQIQQERQAAEEARQAAREAERKYQELTQRQNRHVEDDDDDEESEPYVAHKKFKKETARIKQEVVQTKNETLADIKREISEAKAEARREAFIESNPDFFDTLEAHAEKIMEKSPALGKSILAMPDNFDRQKLVYQTIKELGLDKPQQQQKTIQDTIDANRRNPAGYQPASVGNAPYMPTGDFSPAGQKKAYDKMKQMQASLRI